MISYRYLIANFCLIAFFILFCFNDLKTQNFIEKTYTEGDIPVYHHGTYSNWYNGSINECSGALEVVLPQYAEVTGVDVKYDIISTGGDQMRHQRSIIRCLQNSSLAAEEPSVSEGAGNTAGTYNYERNNLNFANGLEGTLLFQLVVGKTTGPGCYDCCNDISYVINNSWELTVYYSLPACIPPSDLYATQTSPTSYNLGWTANGTETQWNVEVGLQGFIPGTGTQVTGAIGTSDNPWEATGLDPDTQYEFYVDADCGEDGTSGWIGPFVFNEQALSIDYNITENSVCNGDPCDYEGPSILINEVKLYPEWGDGSIYGCPPDPPEERCDGEWIELFNPNACEWVDISCYFLGNNAMDNAEPLGITDYPGGYIIPEGTLIPPLGFFILRGTDAPEVPSHLLVANGGNTVVAVTDDPARVCFGSGNRLWFPNHAGWFAFYDNEGVPQDAISWNDINNGLVGYVDGNPQYAPPCMTCSPCNPGPIGNCTHSGTLASYNSIPADRKTYLGMVGEHSDDLENEESYIGLKGGTFRRIPDGGNWVTGEIDIPTYGTCNATCASPIEASCSGKITVTGLGGTPPYTYSWDYLNTQGPVLEGLCAGTYCVTVRDANNDAITECFIIEEATLDLTASTTTPEICSGETISLNSNVTGGTIPYGFQWEGPAGSGFNSNQQNPDIPTTTDNHHGTYTVTVTDIHECTAEASVNIIVNPNPIADANNVSVCEGEELSLSGGPDGMVSYSWTGPDNFNSSEQNPIVSLSATVDMAGGYTLTVEDSNGCTGEVTIQVGVAEQFDATITPAGPFCSDDEPYQLEAVDDGGTWSGPGVNANTGVFDPSQADIGENLIAYNVGSGICADSDEINITVYQSPEVNITPQDNLCTDDEPVNLIASPTGGTWSGTGVDDSGVFNPSEENIGDNIITYEFTTTDGCTDSSQIIIIVYETPNVEMQDAGPFCSDNPPVTLYATPPGGTWSGPGIVDANNGTFSPSDAEIGSNIIIYEVTTNGCTNSSQITIIVYETPNVEMQDAGPFCSDNPPVTLHATPPGGTWSGPGIIDANEGVFSASQAEFGENTIIYEVDNNGCIDMDSIIINIFLGDFQVEYIKQDPVCVGGSDGYIGITVTGGTPPYTFIVNDIEYPDTGYISGLSAGEYFITITDANGCLYVMPEITLNEGTDNCIKIPNAFTPNGDGINDEWLIENIQAFTDHYIQVFNRWGQEVYRAKHGDAPWDGTYNGNTMPVGPYIYIVKLRENTDNEDEIFVGIVTLIR